MFTLLYLVLGCLLVTLLALFVINSRYSPIKPLSKRPPVERFDVHAVRGEQGENLVRFYHLNTLPTDEYRTYNGFYVPTRNGGVTEVDHVVVSRYGVFVIETKAWTGRIDGDENDDKWRVGNPDDPHERGNPIRQNGAHVAALSNFLDLPRDLLRSVVFFTKDEGWFTKPQPAYVLKVSGLIDYIVGFRAPKLDDEQVSRANARLTALTTGGDQLELAKMHRRLLGPRLGAA